MKLKRVQFDNLKDFLDYLVSVLYVDYISMSFEFTDITIKHSLMNFHVYTVPVGFTFKNTEEVNAVMSRCDSVDTYTQIIIGKNIRINPDVTLTPPLRCRGLVIYDRGTLSNLGMISMCARGCIAEGVDIYLTKTEYVPAIGASGGESVTGRSFNTCANGIDGYNGINRQSGGGGSGSIYIHSAFARSTGAGAAGTSFSGGSGGGSTAASVTVTTASAPENGYPNGGKGGNHSKLGANAGGGQGNPAGTNSDESIFPLDQLEGTGGLLIIYCNVLYNTGNINCDGVIAKHANINIGSTGGSSGGGSLNIFCNKLYDGVNKGQITSNGGLKQTLNTNNYGGAGGNGCVTIDAIKTYSEDNYDESLYNNDKYTELQEPEPEPEDVNEFDYSIKNFLYKGHTQQTFHALKNKRYFIECWGARGSSEDGDVYSIKQDAAYGAYQCGIFVPESDTDLIISVGESGGTGGGGWPEYAKSTREWGGGETKYINIQAVAGGSTTVSVNGSAIIKSIGGKSGTTTAIESSSEGRIGSVNAALSDRNACVTINASCKLIEQTSSSIKIQYTNVYEINYWAMFIFVVPTTRDITFSFNTDSADDFAEFRFIRLINTSTDYRASKYENKACVSGSSGSLKVTCADDTLYAIQVKTSRATTFTFTVSNITDAFHITYGTIAQSSYVTRNSMSNSYAGTSGGMRILGPVNPSGSNVNVLQESNTSPASIPSFAGYHGMVRITKITGCEFRGEQEKITIIPDKLGNRYIKTKYLLECHGAASADGDKGYKVQGIININNPTTLFCNVGEKGKGNVISYNNIREFYSYSRAQYVTPESYGGNTCISINNSQTNKKTVLINANGNGYFNNNINVSGYKCTGPRYTITYESITATSTIGRIYASSYDDYSTGPCVLIINAQAAGTIRLKVENITTGSPRGGILNSNNSRLTGNYYSVDINTSASKDSTYKITVGTAYSDGVIECKFIITYPTSNTYIRTGIRTDGINTGLLTLVRDNLIQLLDNNNYINDKYYEPFLNTNSTLLGMINSYHDNKQYCTLTAVIRNNRVNFSIKDVTNSDVNNLLLVCTFNRDAGGTIYYSCTNLTKGTPRRRMRGERTLPPNYPNNPDGSGLGNDTANTYTASGGSGGYYTVWVGSANGKPTSYDIQISCTSLGDVYIPVNGKMISVYELNRTQLLSSNIIQKNSDLNNYVNPILTDVSISESNRNGNGIIYIKKLPMENDDYILNPDVIKVTEMTDEHSIYPSK